MCNRLSRRCADLNGEVDDGDVGVVELVEHVRLAKVEPLELDVVDVVRARRTAAREPNLQRETSDSVDRSETFRACSYICFVLGSSYEVAIKGRF